MGRAVGELGMSRDDFLDSTPEDLERIFEAHDVAARQPWERARMVSAIMLQPYTTPGHTLRPVDVMRFPWDDAQAGPVPAAPMTREQHRARAQELLNL